MFGFLVFHKIFCSVPRDEGLIFVPRRPAGSREIYFSPTSRPAGSHVTWSSLVSQARLSTVLSPYINKYIQCLKFVELSVICEVEGVKRPLLIG